MKKLNNKLLHSISGASRSTDYFDMSLDERFSDIYHDRLDNNGNVSNEYNPDVMDILTSPMQDSDPFSDVSTIITT